MSETTNLKLKKHDNPETNTEKFDIENYLNGNWDKIDKNVGEVNTNISNINSKNKEQDTNIEQLQENTETSSNKIAELEKELKEAQEDFYQNSIRGQASGEYIHVEDSSNCRSIIGISGNHEQETRSGKNYLNTLAKYKAGKKVTVDGITYIFNEDGSITGNGTAMADSVLTFSSNLQTINGSGKKIVGMITGTQVPAKLSILAYTSDWSKNTFELLSSVNKNITINMQENIDYTIFRIIAYKGTTLNNQTIYYQILDTSVNDLTYEQYGASPSPDYKSEIESVGSNVNEFDIAAVKDGFLNEKTGEIILNNSWKCSDFIEILNKTYTFGWESSSDYFQVTVCYYDENKKFISGKSYGLRGTFNNTFEVVSNAKYMKIAYSVSVSGESVTREKIKLEKGTVATPYSKYGQGCVKVTKCNKNIMPINIGTNYAYTSSGIKHLNRENGTEITRLIVKKGQIIKVGLKLITKPTNDTTFSFYFKSNDNNIGSFSHIERNELNQIYEKEYTAIEDGEFFIKIWGSPTPDIFEFQLWAELNTLTDYVQHEEQSYIIPTQQSFKSVRDIRDTFIKKDGKWYERHNINRKKLDGTENWLMIDNNSRFGIRMTEQQAKINIQQSDRNLTECLSNRLINSTQLDIVKVTNGIAFSQWTDTQYLYLSKIKDSVDELKNYLAANETYVDYPLETPIDLECTEEQSKILDELNNARTYKNVTNITTDSKAILSLDYAKDQETQNQKMQNEIDEIKQLLSTTQTSALLLDNMQNDIESEVE